ncbi:SAM-dependent methyltransferase [Actinoplanes sp. NPDC049265]|uniref:SAM-dependent methyltransferase n=1 Tax=Actinoplanes sp. NPDC049265 TaxID=3363902 RepID=UPI00371EE9C3
MIEDLGQRLNRPRFPRSAGYDPHWMIENWMGPNALWLLEWLCAELDLRPGARVLDLGCGRAATSIFLAREFGVRVVAADHWVKAAENWERIEAAGQAGQIMPVQAEAHDLPFAEGYFDAVVSVDAYHYFGTDDLYLPYLSRFLAPGGQIGIAVPGLTAELDDVPAHLAPHWEPDFWAFHSPAWWQRLWTRSGAVTDVRADLLEDGWRDWLVWSEATLELTVNDFARQVLPREIAMVRADQGRHLGFTRVTARRS